MRKRIYRAENVKQLNMAELSHAVEDKRMVFGVDVAKEEFVGVLMEEARQVDATIKWTHPFETEILVDVVEQLPWRSLEVVMEPSGTYGDSLRALFLGLGIPVFRVSPKRCHDAAEVYDGVPSLHDAKAAAIIAKLHLDAASEPWPMPTDRERELSAAIKLMHLYDDHLYRNINRLEAYLSRYWPELTKYMDLTSVTLLELVSTFGCPRQVALEPGRTRDLMLRAGGHRLSPDKVEKILESAGRSIGVSCIEPERSFLMQLAQEARRAQKEARIAEKRVEELSQESPSVRAMSEVIGKITAVVLVSTLGEPMRYPSAQSYLKSMGLNLKERSSGKHKGKLKITKRGSDIVRLYLFLASLRLIKKDVIVRAWYEKKLQRDGGVKMKAVVAVMRKLALALWHVARGERFDSRLLFDADRLGI